MSERWATRQTRPPGGAASNASRSSGWSVAGVGESPDERRRGQIGRHDDDGVGERRPDQVERRGEIRRRSDPPRRRPHGDCDQGRDRSEEDSCAGAAHRAHARQLGAALWPERSLGEMPDRLAAQGVSRLNAQGVERPEIRFRRAKQRPPADPARAGDSDQHQPGADAVQFQQPGPDVADPCGRDQRRETQDRRRKHDRRRPRDDELCQADLGQEAAGDCEQRLLLGARRVVLGISVARVDEQRAGPGFGRCGPDSTLEGIKGGRSLGVGGDLPGWRRDSMGRFRSVARAGCVAGRGDGPCHSSRVQGSPPTIGLCGGIRRCFAGSPCPSPSRRG